MGLHLSLLGETVVCKHKNIKYQLDIYLKALAKIKKTLKKNQSNQNSKHICLKAFTAMKQHIEIPGFENESNSEKNHYMNQVLLLSKCFLFKLFASFP